VKKKKERITYILTEGGTVHLGLPENRERESRVTGERVEREERERELISDDCKPQHLYSLYLNIIKSKAREDGDAPASL